MFKKIDKINQHKKFKDFLWSKELDDFKRYNLIYGWNGSGKTTLTNVFRAIEKKQDIAEGEVVFDIDNKTLKGNSFSTESIQSKVKVFNCDFIKENVFPDHGQADLIFFLGEQNIKKQEEIKALKEKQSEKNKLFDDQKKETEKVERQLADYCIEKAKAIKEILSGGKDNPYTSYDKRKFEEKCEATKGQDLVALSLDDLQKEKYKKQIYSYPKDKLDPIDLSFIDLSTIFSEIKTLFLKTVFSKVIDKLKDNYKLADWVKDGLTIHQEMDSKNCLFCEKELPEERVKKLEAHFNDGYKNFLTEIDLKITYLDNCIKRSNLNIPDEAKLYEHLVENYQNAKLELENQIEIYQQTLNALKGALQNKRNNPFEALSLNLSLPQGNSTVLDSINKIIKDHNAKTADFQASVQKSRGEFEASMVAESVTDYLAKKEMIGSARANLNLIETEIKKITENIKNLELSLIEHLKPAEEINENLKKYLGHGEFKFEVKETGYQITRDSEIVKDDLSEGEKTAIAIVYFLISLKGKEFSEKEGIIVIDDPVSSLDANALFYAFGFIKENIKSYKQIFIFTHNFSFFRQVKQWFNQIKKRNGEASFYQIVCEYDNGMRSSKLKDLDRLLKNYESEYHYLFSVIYNAKNKADETLECWYHYPNITRRFLEAFLAFIRPAELTYNKRFEALEMDETKKIRIQRFLDTYSHIDSISNPEHDPCVLSETPQILSDVLELIKEEAPSHFMEMKKIVTQK